MLSLIWLAAVTVLVAGCADPLRPTAQEAKITSAHDALAELKWARRILVVSAPSQEDPNLNRQYANMMAGTSGKLKPEYLERDIMTILLVGDAKTVPVGARSVSVQDLRAHLDLPANAFTVILIGKDGGEKRREAKPIESADLFATIDAMPMRRQEMR